MNQPESSKLDTNFLHLILKQTLDHCKQLVTKLEDSTDWNEGLGTGDNLTMSNKMSELSETLTQSLDQMNMIKLFQDYREFLETSITKTNLRHCRLKEEVDWLSEELEYFQSKKLAEENRAQELQKQIDHLTFVYCQRKNRNQEFSNKGLSWIKKELHGCEDLKTDDSKRIDTLSRLINHLPLRNHDSNRDDHSEIDYYDLISSNNSYDNNFRDTTVQSNQDNIQDDSNNISNSTKLTLSELREVILGENEVEHKKPTDTNRKPTIPNIKTKHIKRTVTIEPEPSELMLSKQEHDLLKQSMKTIISKLKDRSTSSSPVLVDTVEGCVDIFVRSEKRTDQMNAFMALIKEFSRKESRSPGIALCWMAIMALNRYEKEFRQQGKRNLKHLGRRKSTSKDSHDSTKRKLNVFEEVRHVDVLNDLCRLLNVVSNLYKIRGELQRSAESLKLILKLRRSTKTLKNESVASVLNNLSLIQASMGNHNHASSYARKALHLRRELLTHDSDTGDRTKTELGIAKQATNLALILLSKHHSDQKRLRYSRFPFRDMNEIPALLNEALQIENTIQDRLVSESTVSSDHDFVQRSEPWKPAVVGDSYNPLSKIRPSSAMNSIFEVLTCSRNGMAIFYICTKKWTKALKQLHLNLTTLDQVSPHDVSRPITDVERSWRFLKLTCIKCLIYVNRMLGQTDKQQILFDRLTKLDPFSQVNDEVAEEDIIRICQNTLFAET